VSFIAGANLAPSGPKVYAVIKAFFSGGGGAEAKTAALKVVKIPPERFNNLVFLAISKSTFPSVVLT
jgi:hypothetical protein